MSNPEGLSNEVQRAQAELVRAEGILHRAVEVVAPQTPDADPLEVFPAPGEVRAEDTGMLLTAEQVADLRECAAELGFGRETDRTLSEQGLRGAVVIIEGGQPHKMKAEMLMVTEDSTAHPKRIYVAASPHRELTNSAEQESARRQVGEVPQTEYDVAGMLIESLPGFKADEYSLNFGYDIHNDFHVTNENTGQFTMKGWLGQTAVILMKVDRDNYLEDGKSKYRLQPGTADLIAIVDGVQRQEDDSVSPITLATSGTYEPSRTVDAVRAALALSRITGVVSYGTERLAAVKGEQTAAPGPIDQLPGELNKLAQHTEKLRLVVERPQQGEQ